MKDFKLDFVTRTLCIVDEHREYKFDVTLLTNCLLGLIVLPKERDWMAIETAPLGKLEDWGLKPCHIKIWKCGSCEREFDVNTIRPQDVVKHLRHAVAHAGIEMRGNGGKISHVQFVNMDHRKKIFEAEIPVAELKTFAVNLGTWYKEHLEKTARGRNDVKQSSGRRNHERADGRQVS